MYFSFQLLFICWFFLSFFQVFVKHFLCLFCVSSILLNLWVLFTVVILSSFHSRLPVTSSLRRCSGVPSPSFIWDDSSDVSFCLNFLCGLCPSGYRIVIFLGSDVCLLMSAVYIGACAVFLAGGTASCPQVGGAGSCPSGGQGCVLWAAMCSGRL